MHIVNLQSTSHGVTEHARWNPLCPPNWTCQCQVMRVAAAALPSSATLAQFAARDFCLPRSLPVAHKFARQRLWVTPPGFYASLMIERSFRLEYLQPRAHL